MADEADPFGTAGIRERVLAAWTASPARFREDANAEQDLTHGAYRDRLLVELAQNAADAAARAGVPGRLRLALADGALHAANTGAPLDPAGVEALATLRASAKRDGGTVGRFGVGFAAVLTVSDEPAVLSRDGGVRFSAARTRALVAAVPALAGELDRRGGQVPVLRLPFPLVGAPPVGWDTEVVLPLRAGAAEVVAAALAELDPVLLLALPALGAIDAGDRMLSRQDRPGGVVLRDGDRETRWAVRRAAGTLPADLLAGRPVEERGRPEWTVTWAVPVDAAGSPVRPSTRPVVHAPTPTDEPLALPAVLLAGFPLGPDRRRVVPGPVTDLLVEAAAVTYAQLVAALPPTPALLDLVPRPRLAAAELDTALAAAVLTALRGTPWLPTAVPPTAEAPGAAGETHPGAGVSGPAGGTRPRPGWPADDPESTWPQDPLPPLPSRDDPVPPAPDRAPGPGDRVAAAAAVVVDAASEELVGALADLVPGLLPAEWSGRGRAAALGALGVRRLGTADVVELVAGIDRPPHWWRALYAALADRPDREAMSGLPVLLADGRTVTGARGVLLPDDGLPTGAVTALGLRVAHPDAAHPLLERLGAVPATARGVLADERVLAAVAESLDEEDPAPVADAVLALAGRAGLEPGEIPELAGLALPGDDGDWYPAGELLLPGSPLAAVLDPDAPFGTVDPAEVERWGADVLVAVGVLRTFVTLSAGEVDLDPDAADHDLDGEAEWMESVLDRLPAQRVPPRADLVAVRDLDLVADWAAALPLLDGVAATVTVRLGDGSHVQTPSYTSWWLSTHPVLDGRRPDELRTAAATDLAGLYDPVDAPPVTGVLTGLDDVLADPDRALDLLERLGDPDRTVPAATLRIVYPRLALVLEDHAEPPERVRVGPDRTVRRADAVVLDQPHLLPLLDDRSPVPAGASTGPVADLLDLPLAGELIAAAGPDGTPVRRLPWAAVDGVELAAARCGGAVPAATVAVHDALTVGGVPVTWWPAGDTDHVVDSPLAMARALAWRLDAWSARTAAAEVLTDPDAEDWLTAEDALA